jgi:hypothetical protein
VTVINLYENVLQEIGLGQLKFHLAIFILMDE